VWYGREVKTISLDLRERIVAAYDAGEGTRAEVGRRFKVSEAMVKKLLNQRRRVGEIAPRHHLSGRKKQILAEQRAKLVSLVKGKPDMTLAELRAAADLNCTLPAIHYVLREVGLTYKKRRSMQPSRIVPMSRERANAGVVSKAASTRRGWSSSTSRRPRQT
jgi:transposase